MLISLLGNANIQRGLKNENSQDFSWLFLFRHPRLRNFCLQIPEDIRKRLHFRRAVLWTRSTISGDRVFHGERAELLLIIQNE